MRIGPALASALWLLFPALIWGRSLRSSDGGFAVEVPDNWEASDPAKPDVVLQAGDGSASLRLTRLRDASSADELVSKFKKDLSYLKRKQASISGQASQAKLLDGGIFYFVRFTMSGRDYRSGYLLMGNRAYAFLAQAMPESAFQGLLDSLSEKKALPPPVGQKPAPEPARPPAPEPSGAVVVRSADGRLAFPIPPDFELSENIKGRKDFALVRWPSVLEFVSAGESEDPAKKLRQLLGSIEAGALKSSRAKGLDCDPGAGSPVALANGWRGLRADMPCSEDGGAKIVNTFVVFTPSEGAGGSVYLCVGINVEPSEVIDFLGRGRLEAAPAGSLGAAPRASAEAAPVEGAGREAPEPALPRRGLPLSSQLMLLGLVLSAGALTYRRLRPGEGPGPSAPRVEGSPYPVRAELRYLAYPLLFEVKDALGQSYRGVSPRLPGLLMMAGIALIYGNQAVRGLLAWLGLGALFPLKAAVAAVGAGFLLIMLGILIFVFSRRKLTVFDEQGGVLLQIVEKRASMFTRVFRLLDAEGRDFARLEKSAFVLFRRRWKLKDLEGAVVLDIREDSALKAVARRLLGHLWGLLRTDYEISTAERPVGRLLREWSIWNKFRVELEPIEGLDHRVAMASCLMIDIVEPDRWHPWIS